MKYFVRSIGNKVDITVDGKTYSQLFTNMADAIKAKDLVTQLLAGTKREAERGGSPDLPEA